SRALQLSRALQPLRPTRSSRHGRSDAAFRRGVPSRRSDAARCTAILPAMDARPERPDRGDLMVALDGPGSSGKSSVGAAAALRLGYRFCDTGLLYRALTWLALDRRFALNAGRLL